MSNKVLLIISIEIKKIKIELEDDANFKITYNLHFGEKKILVPEEMAYHLYQKARKENFDTFF